MSLRDAHPEPGRGSTGDGYGFETGWLFPSENAYHHPETPPGLPRAALPEATAPEEEDGALPLSEHLRDYQKEAVLAVEESAAGRVLVVMPTGAGKSLCIAELARRIGLDGSVLVVTHRKELVEQDAAEIGAMLDGNVGVWSAGLRRKTVSRVTIGGIQSMVNMPVERIPDDVRAVIVDEAHCVRPDPNSQYQQLFEKVRQRNGDGWQLIGLTATPFHGDTRISLVDAGVFDKVVHETPIDPLVSAGWLAPLKAYEGRFVIDEGKLIRKPGGGDFTESSQEAELQDAIPAIVDDVCVRGADRSKWVCFLPGVASCEWVRDALQERGVPASVVVGTTPAEERAETIAEFRKVPSRIRCLVSCNVLTEGFNVPGIDMLAFVRATTSPKLYVQGAGRGTRNAPGKTDCLFLDYGQNVLRHGPISDLKLNKPKDEEGEAVVKRCQPKDAPEPGCGALVPGGCRVCPECGTEFPPPKKVVFCGDGSELEILARRGLSGFPEARLSRVRGVRVDTHVSRAGNSMLRITYDTASVREHEYLFPSRTRHGFKGRRWWGWLEQVCPGLDPAAVASMPLDRAVVEVRTAMRPVLYLWSQPQPGKTQTFRDVLSRICEGEPLPWGDGLDDEGADPRRSAPCRSTTRTPSQGRSTTQGCAP